VAETISLDEAARLLLGEGHAEIMVLGTYLGNDFHFHG
jgi:hypothetical protein